MPKAVAVIILNYKTPVHTANLVNSLKLHCDQNLFDIIIADNGSDDGSLEKLRQQFAEVVFINNAINLGFAEGNNRVIQYSIDNGYRYSLLINSDTLVNEDIITPLAAHLNLHTECAAVQPAIFWMFNNTRLWNGPGYFNRFTGNTVSKTAGQYQSLQKQLKVDWVTGCCVLLRNNVLQKSGLLNSRFFLYYEDVELSFRIRRNGYDLHYLPAVKMYHEAGVSGKTKEPGNEGFLNPMIHFYISRNHLWFLRRYASKAILPFNLLYNLTYYTALWLYFKLKGRNQKAFLLSKGLKEGLFTPLSEITIRS